MDNIQLVDFNDLFVIAIGVSMAYIIFEGKQQSSFFHALSRITETLKNWVLDIKTKPQQREEAVITRIDFFLKSKLLKDKTQGALELVSKKAKEVVDKVHELESWSDKKLKFHTQTRFLSIISYDCFLFGIFVLFAGVFQNKCCIGINGLLEVMLLSMLVLLVHCLWFEKLEMNKKWQKILGPGFILHSLVFITALWFGLCNKDMSYICLDKGVLPICCSVACFTGFIAYLLMNILSNFVLAVIILFKISRLKISTNAKDHENDMKRYNNELNRIENQLKEEKLSQSINISGGSIRTVGN